MWTNWSSFTNNKYSFNIVGLIVMDVNGDGAFELVCIGSKGSPSVVFRWDAHSNELDPVKTDTVRPFADISHCTAAVCGDINGDGVEELLYVHDREYKPYDSYYVYHPEKHMWKAHKIQDSTSERGASGAGRAATAVPGGFLIGRHGASPVLLQWDGRRLRANPHAISAPTQNSLFSYDTNSIVNFTGLIRGIQVLMANGGIHILGEGASDRTQMNIIGGSIQSYPTPETNKMNSRSICFVNIDPKKRIYGFLYANWGQPSILYMYRGDTLIGHRELAGLNTSCAIAADFDNDGHDEIFLLSAIDDNKMYRIYSADRIEEIETGQAVNASVFWGGKSRMSAWGHTCVSADLDRDGYQELYVGVGELNVNPGRYYKVSEINRNPSFNYVRVFPKTRAGAPARGAIVNMYQGDKKWRRIIDNGGNRSGQSEPIAHFGCGSNREPVDIVIEWPNGGAVKHKNVPLNTVIVVQE